MADETNENLRNLLVRRVESAAEQALKDKDWDLGKEMESITVLARLVELHDVVKPPKSCRHCPLMFVGAATFLTVSALLAFRVPETEVELDLSVSEFAFGSMLSQKLTDSIALSDLGISGLRTVEIPKSREHEPRSVRFGDSGPRGMHMVTATDDGRHGSIDLEPLILSASTHVWIRCIMPRGQYRLSIKGPPLALRVSGNGPIQIALAGAAPERVDFPTPKVIAMRGDENQLDIDVKFSEASMHAIAPPLEVNHLSFLQIDRARDDDRTLVRRISTIRSGTIYLEALNSREIKLRANEILEFKSVKGEIRALHLEPDHINLRFHGQVRGLSIGSGEGQRSLMPTWLEWLKERHGLSLFWGSALYLFGLVAGVLRWLGRTL